MEARVTWLVISLMSPLGPGQGMHVSISLCALLCSAISGYGERNFGSFARPWSIKKPCFRLRKGENHSMHRSMLDFS